MERNQLPQAQVNNEQQPETDRLSVATRLSYYAALGASIVGLAAGTTGRTMISNPESASAENVPTATTPDASASLEQQCVQAALAFPPVKKAYVLNPGVKPYAKNSRVFGHAQGVVFKERVPALPPQCMDYTRIEKGRIEKTVGEQWRNMTPGYHWWYQDGRSQGYAAKTVISPSGHEQSWYYWQPGERFRAVLENVVKGPEGDTLGTKTKTVPIPVRGHRH